MSYHLFLKTCNMSRLQQRSFFHWIQKEACIVFTGTAFKHSQAVKSSKPKRGKGKSSKKKGKKMAKEVDILSPAAMLNAYYICHNAPACLAFRGFPWPGSPKKKGKKGK
ncbi:small lysine-rich protein 1 isoform X1 [Falco rusticolus]|nr:small lysine-rich protein 1 isoform X1 [Falco rusticolus]